MPRETVLERSRISPQGRSYLFSEMVLTSGRLKSPGRTSFTLSSVKTSVSEQRLLRAFERHRWLSVRRRSKIVGVEERTRTMFAVSADRGGDGFTGMIEERREVADLFRNECGPVWVSHDRQTTFSNSSTFLTTSGGNSWLGLICFLSLFRFE